MYRFAIEKLLKWKQSKRRKPLIIEGARQVGKTWLMKEFGRQAYADTIYISVCLWAWNCMLDVKSIQSIPC